MKKILSSIAISASLLFGAQAHAVIIDASTIIPEENILLNFNGLDWVYAGPIPTEYFGSGNIETPEYRAGEGWRYATDDEWALRPDWTDFIIGGASIDPVAGFGDHSLYRFASEYWSNFNHIDLSDAANGLLTNGEYINWEAGYETWYVRDARISADVPESSSLILLALGLFGLGAVRGKNRK